MNAFSIGILYFLMMFSRKFRSGTECDKHGIECDNRGSECDKRGSECDKRGSECDKRGSECDKHGSEKREKNSRKRATSLEKAVKYVFTLLPSKEDLSEVQLRTVSTFPLPAIRESVANSVIHQDFYITGAEPVVELFENRVEVTNPGVPLVDVMRIIDNPPKSRNEKLASVMRRLGMCEELGRGWDRMVISCESKYLAAPRINVYQESTRVSLFAYLDFVNIQTDDRTWSTYLHACIKYIEGDALSNSSLRERFGLKTTSSGMVSRLIKEVQAKKLIKPVDPDAAPRYMRYIPIWA